METRCFFACLIDFFLVFVASHDLFWINLGYFIVIPVWHIFLIYASLHLLIILDGFGRRIGEERRKEKETRRCNVQGAL